jgi:hypothetical protein
VKPVVLLCLLLCAAAFADTTYVVVGTPDRSNAVPFWGQTYDAFRLQWLYYSSDLTRSGRIVSVGVSAGSAASANYYNVRLLLCHTNLAQLTTAFADNYAGNTPVEVFSADTLLVGAPTNEWITFPAGFDYDNAKNLIVEVRWRGDDGVNVPLYRRNVTHDYRRVFTYDDTAPSGFADTVPGNHIRFGFVTTSLAEPVQYVEPGFAPARTTIVARGVLNLPGALGHDPNCPGAIGSCPAALVDASGRRALDLRPGPNDVSHLAPGVYYVSPAGGGDRRVTARVLVVP